MTYLDACRQAYERLLSAQQRFLDAMPGPLSKLLSLLFFQEVEMKRQPKRIKAMNATTHNMACSTLSFSLADFDRLLPDHCWPEPVPPPVRKIWRWKIHDRKPFRQLGRNAL